MQRVPPFRHPEAEEWYGYGTALKPSFEPVCLARKPMIGTTRENVHQLGTGALNIDGCRIATDDEICMGAGTSFDTIHLHEGRGQNSPFGRAAYVSVPNPGGRFPANVVHDGSDEVVRLFPAEAGAFAPVMGTE
ncbi:hypothetical protein G3V60_23870, partial [Escherichia coli]|nr:hypothetical protein [Escherichia coli]